MPGWITALGMAGVLCLPLTHGLCQDDPDGQMAEYARQVAAHPASSLAHYHLGEAYLRYDNLQSAVSEFSQALRGDRDPAWTQVWSHVHLARIFDGTGQHDRAMSEYREAQKTGDNTLGALDEANNYLKHAEHAIYLPPASRPVVSREPIQKADPEYTEEARVAELEGTVVLNGEIDEEGFARNLKVAQPLALPSTFAFLPNDRAGT